MLRAHRSNDNALNLIWALVAVPKESITKSKSQVANSSTLILSRDGLAFEQAGSRDKDLSRFLWV